MQNPYRAIPPGDDHHLIEVIASVVLFVLFFVVAIPLWLWRRGLVARILATTWVLGLVYLGYGARSYALPSLSAVPAQPPAAAEVRLPTVTPSPRLKVLVLPTPTPTPVPLPTVTLPPQTAGPQWAVVTEGRLNLRAEASAEAEVLAKLSVGSCVQVVVEEAAWLQVRLQSGEHGWSAAKYLALVPSCPESAIR